MSAADERIRQWLQSAQRHAGYADLAMEKGDLDNAIRHAIAVEKALDRSIKVLRALVAKEE